MSQYPLSPDPSFDAIRDLTLEAVSRSPTLSNKGSPACPGTKMHVEQVCAPAGLRKGIVAIDRNRLGLHK